MSGASPAEVSGLPCRAGGTGQTLGTDGLWRLGRGGPLAYAKGMHSLIRAAMVSCTRPALPRFRFRLAFFEDAKWRRPGLRRSNLPEAVNLNRLATAFFVFRRAMDLGMGPRRVLVSSGSATLFCISLGNLHPRRRIPPLLERRQAALIVAVYAFLCYLIKGGWQEAGRIP